MSEKERRLQLAVRFFAKSCLTFYPVTDIGWKIDKEAGAIVIGSGQPRTMIFFSNIESVTVEEYWVEK